MTDVVEAGGRFGAPIGPSSAVRTIGRGLEEAPVLRQGLAVTWLLAAVGAAGHVVVPVLLQQAIDRGIVGADEVARRSRRRLRSGRRSGADHRRHRPAPSRRTPRNAKRTAPCSTCAGGSSATSTASASPTTTRSVAALSSPG